MPERRKTRFGRVINNRMDKTVVVTVETPRRYTLYRKTINRAVKYKAHDEKEEYKVGERVLIEECRPLSKDKSWRVIKKI